MIRLAMLLVGGAAFRRHWWMLPVAGALWMALGAFLIVDATDGELRFTAELLGAVLAIEGVLGLCGALVAPAPLRAALRWRAAALLLLGAAIFLPLEFGGTVPDRIVFGTAFLFDGALRIASAWVVRFEGWRPALAFGTAQLLVGFMVAGNWPLPDHYVTPTVLGALLISSGWAHVLIGRQLRNLPEGASITSLPLYFARDWLGVGGPPRPHVGRPPSFTPPQPMTLYVWTAQGSVAHGHGLPVLRRYIAAVDENGVISTGHSALEVLPDLYISHYPGVEIDHSPDDFVALLRAGRENDVPGRWILDHPTALASWVQPDQKVVFTRYDEAALRAFWDVYRQDATYNLTSRSCSTVTSLAIDTALEGVLAARWPLARFGLLLLDPNLWLAALLRRRGTTMAWTPGLVLDYARTLHVLVSRQQPNWFSRLAAAFKSYRHSRQVAA
jgi:uncharacterized membrane protein HdeD (DUF308 family)